MDLIQPHQVRWIEKHLIRNDIPFVIIGGVAVKHYCPRRHAADVDIFIGSNSKTVDILIHNLPKLAEDKDAKAKLLDPKVGNFKVGEPHNIDVFTFAPRLEIEEAERTAEIIITMGNTIRVINRDLLIAHKRAVGEKKDIADVIILENYPCCE